MPNYDEAMNRKYSQNSNNNNNEFSSLWNIFADLDKLEDEYLLKRQNDQLLLSQIKQEKFLNNKELLVTISHILHSSKAFDTFVNDLEVSKFIATLPVSPPIHSIDEHSEKMLAKKIFSIQHSAEKLLQKYPAVKQRSFSVDEHAFLDKGLSYILNKLSEEANLPFLRTIIQSSYIESYKRWLECIYLLENNQIILKSSVKSSYSSTERYILSLPTLDVVNTPFILSYNKIQNFQFNKNIWTQTLEYLTKNIQPDQYLLEIFPFFKIS